jgi:hypothetical protein
MKPDGAEGVYFIVSSCNRSEPPSNIPIIRAFDQKRARIKGMNIVGWILASLKLCRPIFRCIIVRRNERHKVYSKTATGPLLTSHETTGSGQAELPTATLIAEYPGNSQPAIGKR